MKILQIRNSCKGEKLLFAAFICLVIFSSSSISAQPVLEVLQNNSDLSIFAGVIEKAGLEEKLNSDGPYTIFAPSNQSLQSMESRLNSRSSSSLESLVLNHIFTGMATKRQIKVMSRAPSIGGLVLKIQVDDNDDITINDSKIIRYNIRAQNGVIHVIDGMLE